MSMEESISMPALFDLIYIVDVWISDTIASNNTSPYNEGCIEMGADKGSTIGMLGKAVQIEYTANTPCMFCDKHGTKGPKATLKGVLTTRIKSFSCADQQDQCKKD